MGLRDRYLTALVARCAVAVPRECNTQQPTKLLHVAPPRELQHATNGPALSTTAIVTPLHATNDATATQHADDHRVVVTQCCTHCQHLTRVSTCTEPVAAGLLTEAEGFGIAWPPDGYATNCVAFTSRR
jgi:hypothetical protein